MGILELYQSPYAIRIQVMIYIVIARISTPLRRYYLSLVRSCSNCSSRVKKLSSKNHWSISYYLNLGTGELPKSLSIRIPKIWPPLIWAEYFSNLVISLIVLSRLKLLDPIIHPFKSSWRPIHCYRHVGLVMFGSISGEISLLFCLLFLSWRLWQRFRRGNVELDLLLFMYQDYETIERSTKDMKNVCNGQILSSTLFYPLKYRDQITYKLRPNRSAAMYLHYTKLTSYQSIIVFTLLLLGTIIVAPVTIALLAFDNFHISNYADCNPELEQLKAENKLDPFSITMDPYRVVLLVLDVIGNLTVLIEAGSIEFSVPLLTALLSYDLEMYWTELDRRLENVLYRLEIEAELDGQELNKWSTLSGSFIRTSNLDSLTRELQADIGDYFNEIGKVDSLMSDIITMCEIIWISTYIVVDLHSKYQETEIQIYIIQVFGFIVNVILQIPLLRVRYKTRKSYSTICSILARDRSKYRSKFMQILEFYTERDRSAFTYFHQYPYVPTTFLSVVGWTLSCNTIIDNLFGKD